MSVFSKKNKTDEMTGIALPDDKPEMAEAAETTAGAGADDNGSGSRPVLMMVISIVLAVALICVTGFMAYRTYAMSKSNNRLEKRVDRDQKYKASEDDYESETDNLDSDSEIIIDKYGAGNTPEKTIMFLVNLSSSSGLSVNSVEFGDEENVTVDEKGNRLKNAAKAPDPTDKESTDRSLEPESDSQDSASEGEDSDNGSSDEGKGPYYLYRYQVTFSYTGTYSELKKAIQYVEDYGERTTVNNITSTYDETTQQLTGAITLNLYTLTGTAKEYTEPNVSGSVGNSDIFG